MRVYGGIALIVFIAWVMPCDVGTINGFSSQPSQNFVLNSNELTQTTLELAGNQWRYCDYLTNSISTFSTSGSGFQVNVTIEDELRPYNQHQGYARWCLHAE